ncbi:hypothetical protein ACVWXO_000467 [Bradyrhizobium sp. LM2.7]
MNPKRKVAQIDRLAGAIGYIATDFERFAGLFLDALIEVPLNHLGQRFRGSNHIRQPRRVGRTKCGQPGGD